MRRGYNEYTGYIPATPIDWAKLTGGLVSTITGIGKDREAQRQELDKLAEDNAKIIQNTELGKTQTFDELILNGSNQARDKIFEWNRKLKNGEIKPVQYKNLINNLKTSWSTFANTAKSYDQQMAEALKRQEANEKGFVPGSELEITLNQRIAELGNLRNKKTGIDDNNGNFIIGELNNDGLLDPSSIMDLRSVGKPGNVIDNRIDLDAIVDNGTKGWEDWTIELGNKTITDALQNPAIQRARLDLAGGILNNPRAISGVLTGYTEDNYDYYFNQREMLSKIADRVDKQNELNNQLGKDELSGDELKKFIEDQKNKFIFLAQDDQGVYQPNLTNDQVKKAQETVLNKIDSRLERKVELDEPQYRSSGGGGGGGGSRKEEKPISNIASKVYNAIQISGSSPREAEIKLSEASGGEYIFKFESDGLNVYKAGDRGQLEKQNSVPFKGNKYADNLYRYFPVNDQEWINDLNKLRQGGGSSRARSGDPLGLGI